MKNTLKVMIVTAMLALLPVQQAVAADYEVANVMDDALYGAGVGGLVGLGLMLLSNKPLDHRDYITRGVGIGIIAGAAYGVMRSSRSFATLEDGQIHLGVPTPELAVIETLEGFDLGIKTNLISGSF